MTIDEIYFKEHEQDCGTAYIYIAIVEFFGNKILCQIKVHRRVSPEDKLVMVDDEFKVLYSVDIMSVVEIIVGEARGKIKDSLLEQVNQLAKYTRRLSNQIITVSKYDAIVA